MSISVNIHHTTRIHAQPEHSVDERGEAHWIRLSIANGEEDFQLVIFFERPELVDAYAEAINGVMQRFAKPAAVEA